MLVLPQEALAGVHDGLHELNAAGLLSWQVDLHHAIEVVVEVLLVFEPLVETSDLFRCQAGNVVRCLRVVVHFRGLFNYNAEGVSFLKLNPIIESSLPFDSSIE